MLSLLACIAAAAEIGVAPGWVAVETAPGERAADVIHVAVRGPGMHAFRVTVADLWVDEAGSPVFLPPASDARSAVPFLSVAPDTVWADAAQPGRVSLSIAAPPEARGGYYAVVFLEQLVSEREWAAGVRSAARVAVPVLVGVDGTRAAVAEVVEVEPADASGPGAVHLEVRNTGDRHLQPGFRGVLRGRDGALVTVAARPEARFLLPGRARELVVPVDVELEPGPWELAGVLELGAGALVPVHDTFVVAPPPAALSLW